ncbi:hypothetical protein ACE1CD_09275 [Aerosakkonema sp. BLCC-F183]|uniref:hypothetical protein n=1 Tax=Aerosakkonema sp. BLCC-F183 TaxID=3342834 RepID=UPI0035B840E0
MNAVVNNSLLALMLALKDLESPLSEDEQSTLSDVAAQLSLDPDAWESDIEPTLMAVIAANPNLNQLYQSAKSQLDNVNGNIPKEFIPTQFEVEKIISPMFAIVNRGFDPEADESDFESNEINNMVISILSNPDPVELTKKLGRFEQLKQFIGAKK